VERNTGLRLSGEERRILRGEAGPLKQAALENIVRYAEVLGAGQLCNVTHAHVFCGAHAYLAVCPETDFHAVFSRMNLAREAAIPFTETDPGCIVQSDVGPCDDQVFEPLGQSEVFFRKNAHFLNEARKAGVAIVGTCAPYHTGWLLVRGEHFVTSESGVTVIGNSLWGAMGNSDGIEAAFWSAICGRTPMWGMHVPENRAGTHAVQVAARMDSLMACDALGAALGSRLPGGAVPVLEGDFGGATFTHLRQLCTSLAVTSNCEMLHIVGITPEARTLADALQGREPRQRLTLASADLAAAYGAICDPGGGELDLVSLGCPHYDIHQIRRTADALDGKKVHPNVHFMVWTSLPVKCLA